MNWKNINDEVLFYAFTNTTGINPFKKVANLALSILSLPWSKYV
jgi:hypothetical protein